MRTAGLLAAFEVLSAQPDVAVHVIGEKNLREDDPLLQRLDAILVPHQAALPASVKQQLKAYWKNGGTLVQDMRLGEFDENGPVFDWMHEVFGIESLHWNPRRHLHHRRRPVSALEAIAQALHRLCGHGSPPWLPPAGGRYPTQTPGHHGAHPHFLPGVWLYAANGGRCVAGHVEEDLCARDFEYRALRGCRQLQGVG